MTTVYLTAQYAGCCRCGAATMQGDTLLYDRELKQVVRCPTCRPLRLTPQENARYVRLMLDASVARRYGELDEEIAAKRELRPLIDKLMGRVG